MEKEIGPSFPKEVIYKCDAVSIFTIGLKLGSPLDI